jgi:hypothetical protein
MEEANIKKSAKPIFIVGFPLSADNSSIRHVYNDLNIKLGEDYHVITYKASEIISTTFTVLNAINATDVEISELIKHTQEQIDALQRQLDDTK